MGKRVVVQDLEYWARLAGAEAERRRIRRAIAPALKRLREYVPYGSSYFSDVSDIDWATRAPKRMPRNAR